MKPKRLFTNPVSAVTDWMKTHMEFIAVDLTRIIAVVFMIVSAVFLCKSLGVL